MLFNSRKFFKVSSPKKLVHSKKGWLVCSAALLAALGIGSAKQLTTHADTTMPSNDINQQTTSPAKSVNITHNTDAQKGYGNVDQDSIEMSNDLNNHMTNLQNNKFTIKVVNPQQQDTNKHNISESIAKGFSNTNKLRPINHTQPNVSNIQQSADKLHAHLLSHQMSVQNQKQLMTNNVHKQLLNDNNTKFILPLTSQPTNSTDKSAYANKGLHAYLSANGKTLTVTGNLDAYPSPTVRDSDGSIIINEERSYGLDNHDNNAFKNVSEIDLGNAYGNKNDSFAGMFQDMPNLSTVKEIGDWDTRNVTEMNSMFSDDGSLSDINALSNWNTFNVSDMFQLFNNDTKLNNINALGSWDTYAVKSIGGAFADTGITSVSPLGNWDTRNVTDMDNLFNADQISDFSPLTDWDTGNVINMDEMFEQDGKLRNLNGLEGWNTSNVGDMSGMFSEDSDLSDISALSDWNTGHVTDMSYMFGDSTKLSNINPLQNWNTNNVSNMHQMFNEDSNLLEQTPIPKWPISNNGTPNDNLNNNTETVHQSGRNGQNDGNSSNWNNDSTQAMFEYIDSSDNNKNIGYGHRTGNNGGLIQVGDFPEGIPIGYKAKDPSQQIHYGSDSDVPVIKIIVKPSATINYMLNGQIVGNQTISDVGKPGDKLDITNKLDIPTKLQRVSNTPLAITVPDTNDFNIEVPVEIKQAPEAAPIVFSYSNQNGQIVGFTKPLANLGKVGQTVNIEPELVQYLPQGYHLSSTRPVNITLNNDSYVNVNV